MKEKNKKLEGIYDRLSKIEKCYRWLQQRGDGDRETDSKILYLWIDK